LEQKAMMTHDRAAKEEEGRERPKLPREFNDLATKLAIFMMDSDKAKRDGHFLDYGIDHVIEKWLAERATQSPQDGRAPEPRYQGLRGLIAREREKIAAAREGSVFMREGAAMEQFLDELERLAAAEGDK
jgi:hypothetical protein